MTALAASRKAKATRKLVLPHNFTPRDYQLEVFQALDSGIKRAVSVWHRRAGKDTCGMHYSAKCLMQKPQTIWHALPTQKQARRAIWTGINNQGIRIIDAVFPPEIVKRKLEDEMMLEFVNGSVWRLVGGDNFDSLVGSNVHGIIYSEAALMDPRGIRYVRPILAENGGWEWQISTPRGFNHFHATYKGALKNPKWFASLKTIEDTNAIPMDVVEEDRMAGMPEELIQQEYWVDFTAALVGSVYGKEMEFLEKEGRITDVPWNPQFPVETAWDLGFRDSTAIWFIQREPTGTIRLIDFYQNNKQPLTHYLNVVRGKPYAYSRHVGPHDLNHHEYTSGKTRVETAREHGFYFTVAPKLGLSDGINATRTILPLCLIDKNRCGEEGVEALKNYRREWDEEKRVFSEKPVHDWTSHPADALRTFAIAPDSVGIRPQWAQQILRQQGGFNGTSNHMNHPAPSQMGHNGGPPLADYDPLSAFRG